MVQLNHDFELWLYILDADWSDLIEISDVTRTVYVSFVALAWAASSSKRPAGCPQCFSLLSFLADRTNGRAIGTVLCPLSVGVVIIVVCDVMCCLAKRCILEQVTMDSLLEVIYTVSPKKTGPLLFLL